MHVVVNYGVYLRRKRHARGQVHGDWEIKCLRTGLPFFLSLRQIPLRALLVAPDQEDVALGMQNGAVSISVVYLHLEARGQA